MPEVKIFLATDPDISYDEYSCAKLTGDVTDWETVTEEELRLLRVYLGQLRPPIEGMHYVLVVKDTELVKHRITSIRKFLEEEAAEEAAKRARAEEKARKNKEKQLKRKAEEEKKLYEELKRKFEETT